MHIRQLGGLLGGGVGQTAPTFEKRTKTAKCAKWTRGDTKKRQTAIKTAKAFVQTASMKCEGSAPLGEALCGQKEASPAERALGAGALAKASVRSARRALNRSARFSAQPERPQERPSGALRSARRSARPERPQERPSGALRSARQERPQERPSEAPAGAPRSACLERPFWSAQERSSRSVRWERSDRSALLER